MIEQIITDISLIITSFVIGLYFGMKIEQRKVKKYT